LHLAEKKELYFTEKSPLKRSGICAQIIDNHLYQMVMSEFA
jgi:hypothetical protein